MSDNLPQLEHDMLIILGTKLDIVIQQLNELKSNTSVKLENLTQNKADKSELLRVEEKFDILNQDKEARLRRDERYLAMLGGGMVILELLLRYLPK